MKRPILFLDIDGVLNNGRFNKAAQSTTLKPACVRWLNWVLRRTDAEIVLSSSWRYLVLGGAMNLDGLELLFRSHGLACVGRIVSTTAADPEFPRGILPKVYDGLEVLLNLTKQHHSAAIRAWQIAHYLKEDLANFGRRPWAVVDNDKLPVDPRSRFVQTNGRIGLTHRDAGRLINVLQTQPRP